MVFQRSDKDSKAPYKADFSMGMFDYERYHNHLIEADTLAKMIINGDPTTIRPFFAVCKVLWLNFKPIVDNHFQKEYQNKLDKIELLFKQWTIENKKRGKLVFPTELSNKLLEFYGDLLRCKQLVGLGIMVSRNETEFTRIRRSAGLIR